MSLMLVTVDGVTFPVDRDLLSSKSDYFRLAIDLLGPSEQHLVVPLPIPAEYFSHLLASLHSPRGLASILTMENVYNLLVYSQLLQMPTAVAQCKAFLAPNSLLERRQQQPQEQRQKSLRGFSFIDPITCFQDEMAHHRQQPQPVPQPQQSLWNPYWTR